MMIIVLVFLSAWNGMGGREYMEPEFKMGTWLFRSVKICRKILNQIKWICFYKLLIFTDNIKSNAEVI